jgi:hypothetical protein
MHYKILFGSSYMFTLNVSFRSSIAQFLRLLTIVHTSAEGVFFSRFNFRTNYSYLHKPDGILST